MAFLLRLLSKGDNHMVLTDHSLVESNIIFLLYTLSQIKINTTDLTEVLWDVYLSKITLSPEVLALIISLHLELIKMDQI